MIKKGQRKGIHKLVKLKSRRLPGVPEYDSSNYQQALTTPSEDIFREVGAPEGTDPPENPSAGDGASNWGILIDWVARLLFPLSYAAFNAAYFVLFQI